MFISKLHVTNFRRYADYTLTLLPGLNVLVGPNGAGKSSILEAINLALNPVVPWYRSEVINESDFHDGNTKDPIVIELWLACESMTDSPPKCEACSRFKPSSEKRNECPFVEHLLLLDKENGRLLRVDDLEPSAGSMNSYTQIVRLSLTVTWDVDLLAAEARWQLLDENGAPFDENAISLRHERDWLGFYLLRDSQDSSLALSFSDRSFLSRIVSRDQLRKVARELLGHSGWETSILSHEPIKKLFEYYQDRTGHVVGRQPFGVTASGGRTGSFLNSLEICTRLMSPKLGEGKATGINTIALPMWRHGQGAEHVLAMASAAYLVRQKDAHAIVAIEEPEMHLEPHLQRWLIADMFEDTIASHSQVIITTHSADIVKGCSDIGRVTILRKERKPFRISTNDAKNIAKLMNADLYSAFFTDAVVVMEGESEFGFYSELCRRYSSECEIDVAGRKESVKPVHLEQLRLEVVDGRGCNARNRCKALTSLGVNVAALLDGDNPDTISQVLEVTRQVLTLPVGMNLELLLGDVLCTLPLHEQGIFFADMFFATQEMVCPSHALNDTVYREFGVHLYRHNGSQPLETSRATFLKTYSELGRPLATKEISAILAAHKSYPEARAIARALYARFPELPMHIRPAVAFLVLFGQGRLPEGPYVLDTNKGLMPYVVT